MFFRRCTCRRCRSRFFRFYTFANRNYLFNLSRESGSFGTAGGLRLHPLRTFCASEPTGEASMQRRRCGGGSSRRRLRHGWRKRRGQWRTIGESSIDKSFSGHESRDSGTVSDVATCTSIAFGKFRRRGTANILSRERCFFASSSVCR